MSHRLRTKPPGVPSESWLGGVEGGLKGLVAGSSTGGSQWWAASLPAMDRGHLV